MKTKPTILKAVKKYYYKNREMILNKNKQRKIPFLLDKLEVAKCFGSSCFICNKPYGSYFTFHHLWYSNNSFTYKNHNQILSLEEVKSYPERFMLLCRACHIHLEYFLFHKETWDRFKKAHELTEKCRKLSNYMPLSKSQ